LASMDSSLMVKMVFSWTGSGASSSAGAAAGAAGAAAPAAGMEMSGMSRRVLSSLTSLEVSRRFNLAISSTIDEIFGSTGAASSAAVEFMRMPPTAARRAVVLQAWVSGVRLQSRRAASYLSMAREERADRRSKDIAGWFVVMLSEKLLTKNPASAHNCPNVARMATTTTNCPN
jgi:hypothetical protein